MGIISWYGDGEGIRSLPHVTTSQKNIF